MFVYEETPKFTHTVPVEAPVDGGHEKQSLRVTYGVMGDEELGTFDMNDRASSSAFLRKVVLHFDDVVGADKQPVSFSDRVRDALIDLPYVRLAMVKGYFGGVYKAALGN